LTAGSPGDTVCSATQRLYYPTTVSYLGVSLGTIDNGSGQAPLFTIMANNQAASSYLDFVAEGIPGATGPGSYAIVHFTGVSGAHAPTANEFSAITPPSDASAFADCSIPPNAANPAHAFTLSCVSY
jgi:hypothetical protein